MNDALQEMILLNRCKGLICEEKIFVRMRLA